MGKANSEEIAVEFEKLLIGAARHAVCQVMAMEVENLCGPKYRPAGNGNRRGGSAKGQFIFRDVRVDVGRPRVRRGKDGGEEELRLRSYEAANEGSALNAAIMRAFISGTSSRDMKKVFPDTGNVSKSEVSRRWQFKGLEFIEELRSGLPDRVGERPHPARTSSVS